jgi:hypothetical protein
MWALYVNIEEFMSGVGWQERTGGQENTRGCGMIASVYRLLFLDGARAFTGESYG